VPPLSHLPGTRPRRWLVTGRNGTVGPSLARTAERRGVEVVGWRRDAVPPDDPAAGEAWLRGQSFDGVAHLAMGSVDWAARLARHAAERGLPFVFTSTAMVFHHEPDGPHAPDDERNARDDYGRYKRACEDAVRAAHPGACVARLGWQIDPAQPGNNMLIALDRWQAEQGCVAASHRWRPACSFLDDTAEALATLLEAPVTGVVHLDSNATEGRTFLEVVRALRQTFRRDGWVIRPHADYVHDQRLLGGDARVPALSERLPALRAAP
jgi:dTDP-4-dehydrorhamnose reductase